MGEQMADKDEAKSSEKESPYPGLRFYDDKQAHYFAGRDRDSKDCTQLLKEGRLLVLHGRSGCGKSSFLRAAVKPMLENMIPGSKFDEGEAGLEVVRATIDPLAAFATKLMEICEAATSSSKQSIWRLRESLSRDEIKKFKKSYVGKYDEISKNGRKCYRLFVALADVLDVFPILVVDQAEEVFTLREKEARELAQSSEETEESIRQKLGAIENQAQEFFDLLRRFANDGARTARLVVSLRTEYKGQFDDELVKRKDLAPTALVKGFYLEDLSVKGLTEAILRPTLTMDEWKKRLRIDEGSVELGLSPRQKHRFEFEQGVAEQLAHELVTSTDVAVGGVLPTMQVTCLRLYEQAKQAQGGGNVTFSINELQRRRIGTIGLQIQEFLAEKLDEVCAEDKAGWNIGLTDTVEKWHEILANKLVEEQADGRAVSSTEPLKDIIDYAARVFASEDDAKKKVARVIQRLCDKDIGLLMPQRSDDSVALGHDSVALSLNKWRVRYSAKDNMMRRMSMSSGVMRSDLEKSDLYPSGYEPREEDVLLHKDLHWDRLYPHFSAYKDFATRLGINLSPPPAELDLADMKSDKSPEDWDDLVKKLRETADDRLEEGKFVLVAADHHTFPWTYNQVSGLKQNKQRNLLIAKWSDVLVTDLFIGNGLIGKPFGRKKKLDEVAGDTPETIGKEYEAVIQESLMYVAKQEGQIKCHDELARKFIVGAAELVLNRNKDEREYFTEYAKTNSIVLATPKELASSGDGLVDWLLAGKEKGRPRFIVGTAAARALSLQAGADLYFATSHLTLVTRYKINSYVNSRDDDTKAPSDYARRKQAQLIQQIQSIIKHTSWQINIPPAQWKLGRNRALILRLAALGYYTSEYIRSNGDEFVRYVRDQLTARFAEAEGGDHNSLRGLRINRDAIRAAVRDCYSIMKFDECGTEFYDLDSTTAYKTMHREFGSKSVASEIYAEMSELRQRTVTNYETLSRIIEWMRAEGKYDPKEEEIREVIELKRCAWNNYSIFNFYDSARLMADATLKLQLKMESA